MASEQNDAADRELRELLGELRVLLPGVTVLFGFLLTLPFTTTFSVLPADARNAYAVAFFSSAASLLFLVGESAYHRVRGKPYDKHRMIRTATRQAVTGTALLLIAVTAVVYLVTTTLYSPPAAALVGAATFVAGAGIWFALPLARRIRS